MDANLAAVIALIFVALTFDYINGFHDAANSIATVVSTKVLTPLQAVLWAGFFNFMLSALLFVSVVFLPLTFGYAIVRYRLMDVDIIFKRGVAYTLATAAIVGVYFGVVGGLAEAIHTKLPSTGTAGLIAAILVTALAFDPLKNWIQDYVDRFFYRKRYDYRRTLIEFGRDLNSETDLSAMLVSVIDRLSATLLVNSKWANKRLWLSLPTYRRPPIAFLSWKTRKTPAAAHPVRPSCPASSTWS